MIRKIMMVMAFLLAYPLAANAFLSNVVTKSGIMLVKISHHSKALSESEIIRLSKLSDELKGTKKVGQELAKMNLPNEVLEDTFMRIAIHQRKISRHEAEEMFARLNSTPGFRSTLRKVIGNSKNKTAGHLNELKIANQGSQHGFKVVSIGEKFSDGLKRSPTDIDIVFKKNGKIFAIEAKDYQASNKLDLIKYKGDLDTLVQYQKKSKGKVIPVFSITNKPTDPRYLKRLQYEADKRGVQLIFGRPTSQVEKIKLLGDIL